MDRVKVPTRPETSVKHSYEKKKLKNIKQSSIEKAVQQMHSAIVNSRKNNNIDSNYVGFCLPRSLSETNDFLERCLLNNKTGVVISYFEVKLSYAEF